MWMSSGDTASVVHTDSVDNIICSLRGIKQVVLVDPEKYSKQVSQVCIVVVSIILSSSLFLGGDGTS